MDYFKFTCPHCRTRIGTSPDTCGQAIACPSCYGEVVIPPAPATESEVVPGIDPSKPKPEEHTIMLERGDGEESLPKADSPDSPFDTPPVPDMGSMSDDNPFGSSDEAAKETKPEEEDEDEKKPVQIELIDNLTMEVKVGIVKQARAHIVEESTWIHGRSGIGGKVMLTAKKSGDTLVPMPHSNPDVTHYSIVGALLVAMDEIHVKPTANGRSEFLHQELEKAARTVKGLGATNTIDPMDLAHPDCIAILDQLQKGYRKLLGNDDFADLLAGKKDDGPTTALDDLMERGIDDIGIKDVIKALNIEIKTLKERVYDLEEEGKEDEKAE